MHGQPEEWRTEGICMELAGVQLGLTSMLTLWLTAFKAKILGSTVLNEAMRCDAVCSRAARETDSEHPQQAGTDAQMATLAASATDPAAGTFSVPGGQPGGQRGHRIKFGPEPQGLKRQAFACGQ